MNIVVIGAGEVGRYLASVLSKEEHNIILIDKEQGQLEEAVQSIDVATRCASGTDWQLLDELVELAPDLLISVTDDDESNLAACTIAKNLGYPRTIARVKNSHYLNRTRLDFGRLFDVDAFICPELLVAHDILKYMTTPGSLMVENFAHGAVQLRTLAIPEKWRGGEKPLSEVKLPEGIMVGLIERENRERRGGVALGKKQIIFPHGNDRLLPKDEATFIGEAGAMANLHHYFGIGAKAVKSVFIMGGSLTAVHLAKLLEARDIGVTIIEKDYRRCRELSLKLRRSVIINQDGTNSDALRAEKAGDADIFIACTGSDEVNLTAAALAKEAGCQTGVVMLANSGFVPLAAQFGLSHTVSPRISAANHILSQIFSGTVRSLVSLYDNEAEIMEVNISMDSSVVGIPLSELGPLLPSDFLIAMVQNRGRVMIAHGDRIISAGDTVIVITHPRHVVELEKIF